MESEAYKRFRELEKLAGEKDILPVVDCRYGYAAFVAYVFRIRHKNIPDEWWVGEINEECRITKVYQICLY